MLDYVQCLVLVCFICVRMQPHPHRQVPLMKNEGHLSYMGVLRFCRFIVIEAQRKIPLLRPEFVGDNVKWARGKIPGQGGRVQKHTLSSVKTGLSPDKSELQTTCP